MKTRDYEIFDFFNSNRQIDEQTVRSIMRSIIKIGYIEGKPILVNKDLIIIDGQHRFEACKRMGLPIFYEETNVEPHLAMIALNTAQKNWDPLDYIKSWASQNIECYIELLKFIDKYNISTISSMHIFFVNYSSERVRQGYKFNINKKADKIVSFLMEAKIFLPFWRDRGFNLAVVSLFLKANDEQIRKLKERIPIMIRQPRLQDYMVLFENLINKYLHSGSQKINLTR